MTDWSWERFWEEMESFRMLWIILTVADILFGLLAVISLLSQPFDTSEPTVIVATIDIVIVVVTLIPLLYVDYRLRERQKEEY